MSYGLVRQHFKQQKEKYERRLKTRTRASACEETEIEASNCCKCYGTILLPAAEDDDN